MSTTRSARYSTWLAQRVNSRLDALAEAAEENRSLRDAYDSELTSHGNSEEKIARSHEGRELIELIQNARDAIDPNGPGQVYVGILDEGILVANTGEPFDLLDEDTERAVKMIGESNKTDQETDEAAGVDMDSDSVGHIGVGLKSTVAVGDDFEVWSRRPRDTEPLRVRYSRAYITAAVAARFGNELPAELDISGGLVGAYADAAEHGLFDPHPQFKSNPIDPKDDLGKAPLFWFPWPLDPAAAGPSNPTLADRANQLLTTPQETLSQFTNPPSAPFRTAVFVEYRDDMWRSLLSEFEIPTPIESPDDPAARADELWEKLSYHGDRSEGFDPETLINLGKIDDLYLERISHDRTVETEHWSATETDPEDTVSDEDVAHRRFDVDIRTDSGKQTLTYDSYAATWDEVASTRPRVLVERPRRSADGTVRTTYPLHLYYPVSSTGNALPVCFHGRFRVTTERKDLSRGSADHNRRVLEHGAELFRRIASGTAILACDPETADHWSRYPWVLLPDTDTDQNRIPKSPKDTADIIAHFRHQAIKTLRETASVPTIGGPATVEDTTLYPSTTGFSAIAAAAEITDTSEPASAPNSHHIPIPETLRATLALQQEGDSERYRQRWEAFVGANQAEDTLKQWAKWLNATHAVDETKSSESRTPTRVVDRRRGQELFAGLVELIHDTAIELDTSISSVLTKEWLEETLPGVYLLPCERADSNETVELVPIEPSPSGQIERGVQSTRTVLWGLDREKLPFSYPPEHGQFDVFFIDQESQHGHATDVLRDAGKTRTWGVREYSDFPSLYEALLQTFKSPTQGIDLGSLAALTDLVSNIEVDSEALGQSELAVGNRSHFTKSLSNTDRRSSLRLRLGIRRSAIQSPNFPDTALSDFSFSDTWQKYRHEALHAAASDPGEKDPDTAEGLTWKSTGEFTVTALPDPSPDAEAWDGFSGDVADIKTRYRLARTISLLGVSSLPGVRYLPLHGDTHPRVNEGVPNWHPAEWADDYLPSWAVKHRDSLRTAIKETGYESFITSYNHHPRKTVSHLGCEKAPTTVDASKQQSYLIGWAWLDPAQLAALNANPSRVRALLDRYSSEYRGNLLTTKWHCRRYSGCSMTDATVPTVANLQLRQLPIWSPIINITETFEEDDTWESEHDRLSCAVIETKGGGRSGWRLFPHIDFDDDEVMVSESLLADLGVVPLSHLDVTGAEHRLQRVQAVLADNDENNLSTVTEPILLSIPSDQLENWKRAYSLLLRPILEAWDTPDDDADIDSALEELLSTLTHVPLKHDGEWYTASIEWVRDNAGRAVWRFQRANPTRWVKSALSEAYEGQPGYHFEHPVQQTGFAEFVGDALRIPSISATEPHLSNDEFSERARATTEVISRSKLQEWIETLESRLPLLLATISARSHDGLESATETLQTGIDNIAVIGQLPADVRADLSDLRSVTYHISDESESTSEDSDRKGIAVVASEIDTPTIGALTQGIALLTKQFGALGTIESVLEADEYMKARRRLEGTYPVEDAEKYLEERRRTNLRTRFELAADLLDWLDYPRPSVEGAAKQLQEHSEEETDFERLGNVIRSDSKLSHLPDELHAYLDRCRDVDEPVREALALLFNPGEDGVAAIRDHITTLESGDRKEDLIEWFAVHSRELPGDFVAKKTADRCRRLAQADAVWIETDAEFLTSSPDWHDAVKQQGGRLNWHEQLPEYAPTERFGTYWLDLTVDDRLPALIERFHSQLSSEIPERTATRVRAYITDGEPLPAPADSSPDHKERAFASATNYLRDNDVNSLAILDEDTGSDDVGPDPDHQGPSTGGAGGGPGPGSFTGRGELAEVAVTLEILARTAAWLDEDPTNRETLVKGFESLYRTQTADGEDTIDYQWHTERRWSRELRPLLTQDKTRLLTEFTDWQSAIPADGSLGDLASIALLDVSSEQGPGFDLIDPVTPKGDSFSPRPIEVKSVESTNPPFSIRLSTNEYQQCKLHVSQSDHPYILRIVYVPSDNPTLAASKDVASYEINKVSELRDLVGHPFDMQVKSGYLRPKLNEE